MDGMARGYHLFGEKFVGQKLSHLAKLSSLSDVNFTRNVFRHFPTVKRVEKTILTLTI